MSESTEVQIDVPAPQLPVGVASPNTLMAVIARAASDPTTDVDKLERLMAMAERLQTKEAKAVYSDAMTAAQAEMTSVSQDAVNDETKSKYASFGALDHAVRPIYTKHGFSISYTTGEKPEADSLRIIARVKHKAGHEEEHKIDIPADGKGAKGGAFMSRTHAAMSAVTYGRRGLLKMIFNIAEGDHDDDGNEAAGPIMPDQVAEITALMKAAKVEDDVFLGWLGVERVEDIPQKLFKKAKAGLEARKKLMA